MRQTMVDRRKEDHFQEKVRRDKMTFKEAMRRTMGLLTGIDVKEPEGVKDYEALSMILGVASLTPCDACRYNPPPSTDGKPCSMCPAEGRQQDES